MSDEALKIKLRGRIGELWADVKEQNPGDLLDRAHVAVLASKLLEAIKQEYGAATSISLSGTDLEGLTDDEAIALVSDRLEEAISAPGGGC